MTSTQKAIQMKTFALQQFSPKINSKSNNNCCLLKVFTKTHDGHKYLYNFSTKEDKQNIFFYETVLRDEKIAWNSGLQSKWLIKKKGNPPLNFVSPKCINKVPKSIIKKPIKYINYTDDLKKVRKEILKVNNFLLYTY